MKIPGPTSWVTAGLRGYQWLISPFFQAMGVRCRFEPSCSEYAVRALKRYGLLKGLWRAFCRLMKCHPFHPGGFDPP